MKVSYKLLAIIVSVFFVASMFAVIPIKSTTPELPDYIPIDKGPEIRAANYPIDLTTIPKDPEDPWPYYEVGDMAYWLALDAYYGYYFFDVFELRAISNNCEIWVQVDLSWPEGDPRSAPIITDEMIEYLIEQFDTVIYPIDTEYFGVPDVHNGSQSLLEAWGYVPPGYYNGSSRNVILVENVRDENYYDPTYPYYIAGFYSSSLEAYMDRNIITIDCYDWIHRLGPEGYSWVPDEYVTRPHLYESVVAHEYQHLIHDDYNPEDATFMNEGCSMYAEILTYNLIDWSSINSFLYTPDNSLVEWGDQGDINILADYGAALLWVVYLSDHYGGAEFIKHFVQAGIPGIEGINAALAYFGYDVTFDDVFRDWRLANLIHSDFPGCGRYNYETIDLNSEEAIPLRVYNVSGFTDWMKGTDFGNTTTILGYDTGISKIGPYGTDYIKLYDWKKPGIIFFDGDDYAIYGWTLTEEGVWWSGAANLMNTLLYGEAYVDPADPTLTLVTKYDIEGEWDFGFVQVSIDGGETWISLENEYTTYDHDPNAHPDIIANLPGLTGTSPDWPDWTTMTFNLSAYAGQTVLIGFRYMTDWATLYEGWYIKSASVSGTPLELTAAYPEADFKVTVIYAFECHGRTFYLPADMWLNDETEEGFAFGYAKGPVYILLAISPTIEKGFVDYQFKVTKLPWLRCFTEIAKFN